MSITKLLLVLALLPSGLVSLYLHITVRDCEQPLLSHIKIRTLRMELNITVCTRRSNVLRHILREEIDLSL